MFQYGVWQVSAQIIISITLSKLSIKISTAIISQCDRNDRYLNRLYTLSLFVILLVRQYSSCLFHEKEFSTRKEEIYIINHSIRKWVRVKLNAMYRYYCFQSFLGCYQALKLWNDFNIYRYNHWHRHTHIRAKT